MNNKLSGQNTLLTSTPVAILVVTVSYFVVAKLGSLTTTMQGNISPVFPAAGLALAAALILRRKAFFGIWLGSFLTNISSMFGGTELSFHAVLLELLVTTFIGIGAMAGAAAGAFLVRHFCTDQYPLNSGRNVLVLVAVGALGCCVISSTVGVLTLFLVGWVPLQQLVYSWLTWWIGDAIGVIIVAPLILAWHHRRPFSRIAWFAVLEAAAMGGMTILLCFFIFVKNVPLQFALIPLLFWSTLRFAERGASTAALVITAYATIGTIQGNGPFVRSSVNESLLLLQAFMGVIVASSLFLAGVLTERNRAEVALRESEAFRRRVFDSSRVPIVVMDAATQEFIDCNPTAVTIYRFKSREETLGKTTLDVSAPVQYDGTPSTEKVRYYIDRALTEGKVVFEWRHQLPDGEIWDAEVYFTSFRSGEHQLIQFTLQDITDRKRVQAERERLMGELELRNAELERFTYTVAHDLRSPLITMRGFLGFLEKDARDGNAEQLKADIGTITNAADKMNRLLRELLELSRIGRVTSPPQQVSFEEIAREAIGLMAVRLQEGGIRVEIATGMPVVFGDHIRLTEVVQNLVENAAKFMGSQPAPLIEVGARVEERDGKRVFFVRDNGIGIEPQYQERIFGLFDKLDPKTDGTGIGLALVKRIIEVHGGKIWVESPGSGSGATFCFTLGDGRIDSPAAVPLVG